MQCAAVSARVKLSSGLMRAPSRVRMPSSARRLGEEASRYRIVSTWSVAVWPAAISAPRATASFRAARVPDVAGPRLDVAAPRAIGGHDLQRHAELGCQLPAMPLVARGALAQGVVHVQRRHGAGTGDFDREIEQTGRVAPAGDEDDNGVTVPQEALRPDHVDHHSSPSWARNISVDAVNPLSRTSPIRSNARWEPAASTTGRVTSTSPPALRAATREAMLTSRP